ncbi:hypothetical protein ZHAS_00013008 [Anopheles sinensis]|uniref:ASXH domain-containing protein n=1 Tax=Anopheles sinensis TaxID=74873 RepID=A0A084W4E5_ANOSI|nr:hypothetical protein ZHAS_00013008 [Anopheles sinensis]
MECDVSPVPAVQPNRPPKQQQHIAAVTGRGVSNNGTGSTGDTAPSPSTITTTTHTTTTTGTTAKATDEDETAPVASSSSSSTSSSSVSAGYCSSSVAQSMVTPTRSISSNTTTTTTNNNNNNNNNGKGHVASGSGGTMVEPSVTVIEISDQSTTEDVSYPELVSCPESESTCVLLSDEYDSSVPLREDDPLNVSIGSIDMLPSPQRSTPVPSSSSAAVSPAPVDTSGTPKHNHHLRRNLPRMASGSSRQQGLSKQQQQQQPSPVSGARGSSAAEKRSRKSGEGGGASTMREVLASIPGFSIKPRRRTNKKLSTAAQLEQTREGCVDLETPDSILVHTNLRALLNRETFQMLPPLYQYKLVQLLPPVDRPPLLDESECVRNGIRLNPSGLNNEFFARACHEWRDRLSEGEFTPEAQLKLRSEAEREKSKLDPWKLKHFEPMWGERKYAGAFIGAAGTMANPTPPPPPAPPPPPPPQTQVTVPSVVVEEIPRPIVQTQQTTSIMSSISVVPVTNSFVGSGNRPATIVPLGAARPTTLHTQTTTIRPVQHPSTTTSNPTTTAVKIDPSSRSLAKMQAITYTTTTSSKQGGGKSSTIITTSTGTIVLPARTTITVTSGAASSRPVPGGGASSSAGLSVVPFSILASSSTSTSTSSTNVVTRPALKTTIKLRPTTAIATSTTASGDGMTPSSSTGSAVGAHVVGGGKRIQPTAMSVSSSSGSGNLAVSSTNTGGVLPKSSPKRLRTVGAVTRSALAGTTTGTTQQQQQQTSTTPLLAIPSQMLARSSPVVVKLVEPFRSEDISVGQRKPRGQPVMIPGSQQQHGRMVLIEGDGGRLTVMEKRRRGNVGGGDVQALVTMATTTTTTSPTARRKARQGQVRSRSTVSSAETTTNSSVTPTTTITIVDDDNHHSGGGDGGGGGGDVVLDSFMHQSSPGGGKYGDSSGSRVQQRANMININNHHHHHNHRRMFALSMAGNGSHQRASPLGGVELGGDMVGSPAGSSVDGGSSGGGTPTTQVIYDHSSGQMYSIVCIPSPPPPQTNPAPNVAANLRTLPSSLTVTALPQQQQQQEQQQLLSISNDSSNSSSVSTTAMMAASDNHLDGGPTSGRRTERLSTFENVLHQGVDGTDHLVIVHQGGGVRHDNDDDDDEVVDDFKPEEDEEEEEDEDGGELVHTTTATTNTADEEEEEEEDDEEQEEANNEHDDGVEVGDGHQLLDGEEMLRLQSMANNMGESLPGTGSSYLVGPAGHKLARNQQTNVHQRHGFYDTTSQQALLSTVEGGMVNMNLTAFHHDHEHLHQQQQQQQQQQQGLMMMVTTTAEDDGCGPSPNAIGSNYCDNLSAADEADGEEEEEEEEEEGEEGGEEHNEAGHHHLLMDPNTIGHVECAVDDGNEDDGQYGLNHHHHQQAQQLEEGGVANASEEEEDDDEEGQTRSWWTVRKSIPGPQPGDSVDSSMDDGGQMQHLSLQQHPTIAAHQHYQNHHQLVEKYIEEVDGSGGGSVVTGGGGGGGPGGGGGSGAGGYVLETAGGEMMSTEIVEHNHHDHATMVDGQKDQRMGEVAEPVSDRDHRGEMPLDDGGTVPEEHRLLDANDGMLHEVGTIVEVPHEEHQEDEEHQPEQQHQSSSMAIDRGVDVNMLHQAVEQRVTDVVVNRPHVPMASEAQMKSMPVAEHFQPTTATVSNANLSTVPAIRRTTTILVVEDCIPTNGIDHQHSYQHPPVRYGRRQSNDHEEARTRMARTMLPVKLVPESKKTFPLMDPALDHLYLVEPGSAGSVPTTVGALGETNLTRHGCSVVRPGPGDETLAPCGDENDGRVEDVGRRSSPARGWQQQYYPFADRFGGNAHVGILARRN